MVTISSTPTSTSTPALLLPTVECRFPFPNPKCRPSSTPSLLQLKMLKVLRYLDDRRLVHKNAISFCQNILKKKAVDWKTVFRNDLSQSICGVDLVISVGGDGTLLQASHFMDDSVPVLGVNSNPTQQEEVEEFSDEFDATRSTGYLCAATTNNFERARLLL